MPVVVDIESLLALSRRRCIRGEGASEAFDAIEEQLRFASGDDVPWVSQKNDSPRMTFEDIICFCMFLTWFSIVFICFYRAFKGLIG